MISAVGAWLTGTSVLRHATDTAHAIDNQRLLEDMPTPERPVYREVPCQQSGFFRFPGFMLLERDRT